MFLRRGQTFWAPPPDEAAAFARSCQCQETIGGGPILGCAPMRIAIDRWLASETGASNALPGGEVPIEDIAVETHRIETRATDPVPYPATAAGAFREPADLERVVENPGSTDIDGFHLRDVWLDPASMILYHRGRRIAETRYIVDDADYWRTPPAPVAVRVFGADTVAAIGGNLARLNYYHWMMQSLPAIDAAVRRIGPARCSLLLHTLPPWQEETLAMLGFDRIPRIVVEPDVHYYFARAWHCGFLTGWGAWLSPAGRAVMDRLAAQVEPFPDAPERLYVSRADTKNRVIRNEDAVRRVFEKHGFVAVVCGDLSLRAQICLFRTARFVAGGHGAGMTNIAFCRPGARVLELLQSSYPMVMMNRIAQMHGLRYHAECFESADGPDIHAVAWTVDIERLEARLAAMLSEP